MNSTIDAQDRRVSPQMTQDARFALAAIHLRSALANKKFARKDRRRRVMEAVIDEFARGFWPLKISKGGDELAAVVPDGIQKNHCIVTLKELAAKKMVSLDWNEDPGMLIVRLECNASNWCKVDEVCGEMDWQRRRDALERLNGRVQWDLIEREPDLKRLLLETNAEILIEQKTDALTVSTKKNERSNVAFFSSPTSRDGKISRHGNGIGNQLPDTGSKMREGIEACGCEESSMKSRTSCANAKVEKITSPRARARVSIETENSITTLPIGSMSNEKLKAAINGDDEREFCAAARQIIGVVNWEDGRSHHWQGDGSKWRARWRDVKSQETVRIVFRDVIESGGKNLAATVEYRWQQFGGMDLDSARHKKS